MQKKLALCVCAALMLVALAAGAAAAQAETKTLVSSETNSLCVNPVKGFEPTLRSGAINYAPLSTSHGGGTPFPDTGKACASKFPTHPVAMGAPGAPAAPYTGSITGASWVSINATGSDSSNPPPKYYIYDARFELCANQVAGASISGTMFADNEAGAFLNGESIGFQPLHGSIKNFDGPPAGGWPFGPATGPFKVGVNTLQIVVLDESPSNTAVDFSATVTAPPTACPPPEFPGLGRCVHESSGGGGYEGAGCAEEAADGSYEWEGGAVKNKFTSKEGLSYFRTVGGLYLACKSDTDTGEYVGESEDFETITFKDCDIPGRECKNQAGGFVTKRLRSLYGVIVAPSVGVSLEPASGTIFAEFTCGSEAGSITGSVIAPVTPVGVMTKKFTETFAGSGGLQIPENFAGEPKDTLACVIPPSTSPEQCALESTDKITNEEKLEIRATP